MREVFKIFVASVSLVACSFTVAHAQEDTYVSFSSGVGLFDLSDADKELKGDLEDDTGSTATVNSDESAFIARAAIGTKESDNFSVEIGFFASSELDTEFHTKLGFNRTISSFAHGFDLVGKYHLANSNMAFKAGLHRSKIEMSSGGFEASHTGTGLLFGGEVDVSKDTFIGYDYYQDVGGESDGSFSFFYFGKRF